MMQQNQFLIEHTKKQKGANMLSLKKLKNLQIQYDQARTQMKELYDSHVEESRLQEQIMEAKVQGISNMFDQQIRDMKNELDFK